MLKRRCLASKVALMYECTAYIVWRTGGRVGQRLLAVEGSPKNHNPY